MMRICWILYTIDGLILLVSSMQYNQRCTFSLGTCDWNLGRRWQIKNLDGEIDDKVIIAVDGSQQDQEMGFTDVITSSWLYLTPSCSFHIRLTFQFSIENEQDQIEVFLIQKSGMEITSIGRWKALTIENSQSIDKIESLWQQANITFKAAEEFQIEIEIRHLPDRRKDSSIWFAIDDILIESCPHVVKTKTRKLQSQTTPIPTSFNMTDVSSSTNRPFFRFRSKPTNSSHTPLLSSSKALPSPPRITFLSFTLYTLCALIPLIILITLLAAVIFAYRKYCLPATKSSFSAPIIQHRSHSNRKKRSPRHDNTQNSNIDQDARTERTMITTIRS